MEQKWKNEIIAWANGATIQRSEYGGPFADDDSPDWGAHGGVTFRVRPERIYPESALEDIALIWSNAEAQNVGSGLHAVANAAIRDAIDAGQVMGFDEHDVILGEHCKGWEAQSDKMKAASAARELEVAAALRNYAQRQLEGTGSAEAAQYLGVMLSPKAIAEIISQIK